MKSVILILLLLFSVPAYAAPQCYTPSEAEADQGIRIHSELMVIGLNCQHMGIRYGDNLYLQYKQFTAKYAKLFSTYETVLMAFFKRNGDGNPVATLNTLRTKYANKISTDAAGMRPDIFCSKYAPRVIKAHAMSEQEVRQWAATIFESHPVSHPTCKT